MRVSADVINNKSTARGINEWQPKPEIELQLQHSVCGSVLLFVIDGKWLLLFFKYRQKEGNLNSKSVTRWWKIRSLVIRERGLLEIEMYKCARQQFCSRGYIWSLFVGFWSLWAKFFSSGIVHTYKINRGTQFQEFCLCLAILCPKPIAGDALLSLWPGSPRREQRFQR